MGTASECDVFRVEFFLCMMILVIIIYKTANVVQISTLFTAL